ncbi:MAG: trans-sulfuration enzyme family protein [Chloroflexota bacterium]
MSDPGSERAPVARGFSTRAIQAASRAPRVDQRPTNVPIYQTVTFAAADVDELDAVATDRQRGYAYSRLDNPTIVALGDAIAELEGAEAGYVVSSGMAAVHAALVSLLESGDRVVSTRAVYGSTRSLLNNVLGPFGVTTEYVDATDLDAVERALTVPTRVLYTETISNPNIVVVDHAALADLAHRHGATYVVDNTFASPYLCRPIELGADLVIESATKYLGGHSDVLAGSIAGSRGRIDAVRAVQIDTGASLAPLAAFLVLRGIDTLAVRLDRHASTSLTLAAWLEGQEGVERVFHPDLPSHPQADVARRQLRSGGGMFAFELAGGRRAGRAFIDALRIAELTASLGSVHTMVVHPPSTTHRQLDDAGLAEAGIGPGLLRCSIGLEDVEDLQADFAHALEVARATLEPTAV